MKKQKVSALLLALCVSFAGTMTAFASEVPNVEQQIANESMQEETVEQAEVNVEIQEPQQQAETKATADENGFVIEDGVLVKYEGSASEVAVPDGVTRIGEKAFSELNQKHKIMKVTLPDSVTSIGKEAFYCCELLESINIPEGIAGIEDSVFGGCLSLKQIILPESIVSMGYYSFANCFALESINFPKGMKSIGEEAFFQCYSLKNVILPEEVESIGAQAFRRTGIETITIPRKITTLESMVLAECDSLKSVILPEGLKSIGDYAVGWCEPLESINIPDGLTTMGEGPFFYCAKLIVKIPNSVTSMGPFWRDAYGDEIYDEGATICAKEGSYAKKYAQDNGIPFILWEEEGAKEEPEQTPVYEVVLTKETTTITSADLQALAEINKTQDVVIKTSNGVVFTFEKGSMKMIDGKTEYDFGTEIVTDYTKVGKVPFTSAETAFRVNYNYDGELPGTASITIPVDAKWNGKTLYYYQIVNDGKVELKQNAVVSNGAYTISQNHCSDYVASTKELKAVSDAPEQTQGKIPEKTPEQPLKQTSEKAPKTGDTVSVFTLISMIGLAGTTISKALKKN